MRSLALSSSTGPDLGGINQYSDAFADWLVERYMRDNEFFAKARARYYALSH